MNTAPGIADTVAFDIVHPPTGQVDQPGSVTPQETYIPLDKLIAVVQQLFPALQPGWEQAQPAGISLACGKKSFLVFKHNKYTTINTDDIAYIYMQCGSPTIVTYKDQQFPQARSLDQIQNLLSAKDFFRVNRQYLVSFRAIREVEHYSARKLLVNLVIPSPGAFVDRQRKSDHVPALDGLPVIFCAACLCFHKWQDFDPYLVCLRKKKRTGWKPSAMGSLL